MKTKLKPETITNLLEGMTKDELNSVAVSLELPKGKTKQEVTKTIVTGIQKNKVKFTSIFYLKTYPTETNKYGSEVYRRKVRNTADDKVIFFDKPTPA